MALEHIAQGHNGAFGLMHLASLGGISPRDLGLWVIGTLAYFGDTHSFVPFSRCVGCGVLV